MTWIKKSTTGTGYEHSCRKPLIFLSRLRGYGAGSLWQCDECKETWQIRWYSQLGYVWGK